MIKNEQHDARFFRPEDIRTLLASFFALLALGPNLYTANDVLDGNFALSSAVFGESAITRVFEPFYPWTRLPNSLLLQVPIKFFGLEAAIIFRFIVLTGSIVWSSITIFRAFKLNGTYAVAPFIGLNASILFFVSEQYVSGLAVALAAVGTAVLSTLHTKRFFSIATGAKLGILIGLLSLTHTMSLISFLLIVTPVSMSKFFVRKEFDNWHPQTTLVGFTGFFVVGLLTFAMVIAAFVRISQFMYPERDLISTMLSWGRLISTNEGSMLSDRKIWLSDKSNFVHLGAFLLSLFVFIRKKRDSQAFFCIVLCIPSLVFFLDSIVNIPLIFRTEFRYYSSTLVFYSLISISLSLGFVLQKPTTLSHSKRVLCFACSFAGVISFIRFVLEDGYGCTPLLVFGTLLVLIVWFLVRSSHLVLNELIHLVLWTTAFVLILIVQWPTGSGEGNSFAYRDAFIRSSESRNRLLFAIEAQDQLIKMTSESDEVIVDLDPKSTNRNLMSAAAMSYFGRNSLYNWDWVWRPENFQFREPTHLVIYSDVNSYQDHVVEEISGFFSVQSRSCLRFGPELNEGFMQCIYRIEKLN